MIQSLLTSPVPAYLVVLSLLLGMLLGARLTWIYATNCKPRIARTATLATPEQNVQIYEVTDDQGEVRAEAPALATRTGALVNFWRPGTPASQQKVILLEGASLDIGVAFARQKFHAGTGDSEPEKRRYLGTPGGGMVWVDRIEAGQKPV